MAKARFTDARQWRKGKLAKDGEEVPIEENGYIYIYVANESNEDVDTYFDDMEVQLIDAPVTSASDYYPFGLAIKGRSFSSEKYRFGYQGQFAELDKETGWNSFEARMYEPVIGRWLGVDPLRQYPSPFVGMGNNPVKKYDPDGKCDDFFEAEQKVIYEMTQDFLAIMEGLFGYFDFFASGETSAEFQLEKYGTGATEYSSSFEARVKQMFIFKPSDFFRGIRAGENGNFIYTGEYLISDTKFDLSLKNTGKLTVPVGPLVVTETLTNRISLINASETTSFEVIAGRNFGRMNVGAYFSMSESNFLDDLSYEGGAIADISTPWWKGFRSGGKLRTGIISNND